MQKLNSKSQSILNTSFLVKVALLTALSVIGSYLKFPGPVGSIALDSLPGFLGAVLLGGKGGALILVLGHFLSALNSGFPLGPIHILIAFIMGSCGFIFSYLMQKNIYLAVAITTFVNGAVSAALLIPFFGIPFFYSTAPVLTVASLANIILAVVISKLIKDKVTF
ncbi:MAG: ECF transporter S component [Bacillota bacterium]